ncbi:MAG: transporter substrate-binding domain-containing protein [Caulobacter sp.]|nr:transporter substrate-binding domain-containing protein [Vitreoscilla sp.]
MTAATFNRRALLGGLGALAAGALPLDAFAAGDGLAGVKARGTLTVAVYNDMPPFNDKGRGIDVDLAAALAESLGVKLSLMPFTAGEEMDDDLRNMVWKGHYLGYGPADVMLHVPVEAPLMDASPQVRIFAPYWHDRVMIARNVEQLPHLETLAQLNGKSVAVPGDTLASVLMIGADGGAYRSQLTTTWKNGVEAAAALKRGEFPAAAGLDSELQSVLAGDPRFVINPLPTVHNSRSGWAVGMAVKKDAGDLATALQARVDELARTDRLKQIFAKGNLDWHVL